MHKKLLTVLMLVFTGLTLIPSISIVATFMLCTCVLLFIFPVIIEVTESILLKLCDKFNFLPILIFICFGLSFVPDLKLHASSALYGLIFGYFLILFTRMSQGITDFFNHEPEYSDVDREHNENWRWEIKKKVLKFTNSRNNVEMDLEKISEDEKQELIKDSYHLNFSGSNSKAEISAERKEFIRARIKSISKT